MLYWCLLNELKINVKGRFTECRVCSLTAGMVLNVFLYERLLDELLAVGFFHDRTVLAGQRGICHTPSS